MSDAQFAIWRVDGVDVIRIDGALDLAAAVRLRLTLYGRLDAGAHRIVVDLSKTTLIDAAAVNVLLQVRQRLVNHGGTLTAPGASGMVLAVLRMLEAADLLAAGTTVDPALTDPGRDDGEHDVVAPHSAWGDDILDMFQQLRALAPEQTTTADTIRKEIILRCLPSARTLAARFYRLGESTEDLDQVAALALVKAVNQYRPQLGTDFAAYAVPTIVGELKRHLRDKGWAVHVPRRLQELRLEINRASVDLTAALCRAPTTRELAERLAVDESEIIEAQRAMISRFTSSLSEPVTAGGRVPLADTIAVDEHGYAAVDHRESLRILLNALPVREREIIQLRFFGELTQTQIADRIGISQMHVSRLLTRTLAELRTGLLGIPPQPSPAV